MQAVVDASQRSMIFLAAVARQWVAMLPMEGAVGTTTTMRRMNVLEPTRARTGMPVVSGGTFQCADWDVYEYPDIHMLVQWYLSPKSR